MQLCINVNVVTASLRFLRRFATTSWMSLKRWTMKILNCLWSTRSKSLNSKEDIYHVNSDFVNCVRIREQLHFIVVTLPELLLFAHLKTTHMLKYLIVIKNNDCYQTGFLKTWPVCHWLDKQVVQFTCWAA